ncbi:MAG TPA: hypothetical protein VHX19_04750, partial [Stellaceae bacterium]|nr:hypothetical protein [Stellaceae bacterium]
MFGQWLDAIGQGRIVLRAGQGPVCGRRCLGRGIEIVAECGAESCLKAFGDGDFFDHGGPTAAGRRAQKIGQRLGFGFASLRLAFGALQWRAHAGLGFACLSVRGLAHGHIVLCGFRCCECGFERLPEIGLGVGRVELGSESCKIALDLLQLGFETCQAL